MRNTESTFKADEGRRLKAVSEVLPDGDKQKQLLQGLLNQRDKVEEAMKQGELFS